MQAAQTSGKEKSGLIFLSKQSKNFTRFLLCLSAWMQRILPYAVLSYVYSGIEWYHLSGTGKRSTSLKELSSCFLGSGHFLPDCQQFAHTRWSITTVGSSTCSVPVHASTPRSTSNTSVGAIHTLPLIRCRFSADQPTSLDLVSSEQRQGTVSHPTALAVALVNIEARPFAAVTHNACSSNRSTDLGSVRLNTVICSVLAMQHILKWTSSRDADQSE